MSLLEVQASALSITEEFEEMLNEVCNAEELIDLAEVQSNIFKAIMSGSYSKIAEILYSYVKEANTVLEPELAKKLLTAFQDIIATKDNKPETFSSMLEDETKHLPYLPEIPCIRPKTCLNNVEIDKLRVFLY